MDDVLVLFIVYSIIKHGSTQLLPVAVARNVLRYFSQTMATEKLCHSPTFVSCLLRHGFVMLTDLFQR